MVCRILAAVCLTGFVLCGVAAPAAALEPPPRTPDAATVARHVWVLTEEVLKQHVEPPARQQMVLSGARALLKSAGVPAPADLGHRVSGLTTEEQYTAFVRDIWGQSDRGKARAARREEAFLAGLLASVPGRPHLVPAEELRVMEQLEGNRYVGTGIQIGVHKETQLTQILLAFPGGPARRAGARTGDLILEVDGVPATGGVGSVVRQIRGPEGTDVTLLVRQPDSTERRKLPMIRGVVPFETVVGHRRVSEESWKYRVEDDLPVAYIRLVSLRASTLHELRRLEPQLQKDGCRALVLDLRSCVGDQLPSAAMVADGLLESGVLWRVRDGHNHVREYKADRDCLFRGLPMLVLTNDLMRSLGADLLAAALQDNGRAKVVGGRTLPRVAYLTSLVTLPDGLGTLSLPTARIERCGPRRAPGESQEQIEAEADTWIVRPDYEVKMSSEQSTALGTWQRQNENAEQAAKLGPQAPEDPQLAKALNLLRTTLKTQ
jgi:carboxyl-terminal processing protease